MKTNLFNVLKLGAKNDGKTLNTKVVQSIIDEAAKKRGIVYFPKGEYVLSTIHLRDNTEIFFAKGAIILGSLNFYDYEKDEKINYPLYQDASHSYFHSSLFVGENISNIKFHGEGAIDMQSVWDEDNIRNIVHRGNKCIALKNCKKVLITDIKVLNCTDLAIYFAGCEKVTIRNIDMKTYIDGISPDCSKDVLIENCKIETGDDGVVLKSSYTLNKLLPCENIVVRNCEIKSRCNAIKFGTESNCGFKNIKIHDIKIKDTRITGISIETVDGAEIDNVSIRNIEMVNVGTPMFVHIGKRLRGPQGIKIGSINNVTFDNISAKGPYKVSKNIPWNYVSYQAKDYYQFPGFYSKNEKEVTGNWQITSNICGLKDNHITNLSLKNIYFELDGGVEEFDVNVPNEPQVYPEVNTYGRLLPASGIYFRYVDNLVLQNIKFKFLHKDKRDELIFDHVLLKAE